MKKIKFLLLLGLIPLMNGCYNYRELNELGIITAISIDYKEGNYKVISQVINPVKQQDASSGGEPSFVNYESEGSSLQEAFRLTVLDSPRQLYASQIQILILSEEVINGHLPDILDFFMRDPEIRSEFKIIVAKSPEDLKGVTIQTLLDNLSSSNILDSLEVQQKKEGLTLSLTLNDLTNMYLNPYLELALPSMKIEGNAEAGEDKDNVTSTVAKTTTKIDTTAIFKDKNLLGYLTDDESKVVTLIKGELTDTILNLNYKDGYIVFEPNKIKTKTEADLKKNTVTITVEGYSRVNEIAAKIDLKSPKEVEKLEKFLNKEIEKIVKEQFTNIRDKYNSDIFGFRDLYYKTDHKYFKKNCQNWYGDIFPNLEVKVKSKIKLYEKGNTLGGIEYERKNK